MTRIIAGTHRGRRLVTPPRRRPGVRPTSDRVRTILFDILGPDKDESRRFAIKDALGLELAGSTADGYYSAELKLPLRQSELHPFAIGTEPGQTIEITLKTAKLEGAQLPARGGSAGGGRSGGGRAGGMPGGGRGGPGGSRKGMGRPPGESLGGEPLKIEAEIDLAP